MIHLYSNLRFIFKQRPVSIRVWLTIKETNGRITANTSVNVLMLHGDNINAQTGRLGCVFFTADL